MRGAHVPQSIQGSRYRDHANGLHCIAANQYRGVLAMHSWCLEHPRNNQSRSRNVHGLVFTFMKHGQRIPGRVIAWVCDSPPSATIQMVIMIALMMLL